MKKSSLNEKISSNMEKSLNGAANWFFNRTATGQYITAGNAFIGCGVLAEPEDHIKKAINTMWLFGVGSGEKLNEPAVVFDTRFTLAELKMFHGMIGEAIEQAEEFGLKR